MCRLLAVQSPVAIDIAPLLSGFALVARRSREYQGHGWGCAFRAKGRWEIHKSIRPIWEDVLPDLPRTRLLVAHARSAFRDGGIRVENNMPFSDGTNVFAFNGELRGVRIRERGRIGAEKVFNFIKRFENGRGMENALRRATRIIEKRTDYVRAMNLILSDGQSVLVHSRFTEDAEYFTMHYRRREPREPLVVCSEPIPGRDGWVPIGNGETCRFP
ncbi:MAG TPA: class II glutamine amidotransferase [Vicinamibacteria bacterium]|nr:class II glutamine amidotransferase [Vicinamibacteria bacterium]